MRLIISIFFIVLLLISNGMNADNFEKDVFKTSEGDLAITFIGHGTLMMEFNGKVIHIDPVSNYADYSALAKADLILVTHDHGDHLDLNAIDKIKKANTRVVVSKSCAVKYNQGMIMQNGESNTLEGIKVVAVPAYNIKNTRGDGQPFHPKGAGNGYILHFGDKKVYVAGDTENIPEMAELKNIDIAFLPMNLPYTMTPEMVAGAVNLFHPKVLYPYHFGNSDTNKLLDLLKNQSQTEIRIRKLN